MVFGGHLLAIRYVLFVAFLAWLVMFHHVAARMVSPIAAGVVTLMPVFWSVPHYPAAMASWCVRFSAHPISTPSRP